MMYRIDDASRRKVAPRMSAFPTRFRSFREPVSASEDQEIGSGVSLPDLIRRYYKGSVPLGFSSNFGFLDRDNKERDYVPGKTDRFVFKDGNSVDMFRKSAHTLIKELNRYWTELGLPLDRDEDRDIDVPDTTKIWSELGSGSAIDKIVQSHRNAVYFIIANVDIMKKACIVRTVNAGWWAVSYAGKNATDFNYFAMSLAAHKTAVQTLIKSPKVKALYEKNWNSASDPLTTNPGYPFFNAQVDTDGNPTTRIKTVQLFRNLNRANRGKWNDILQEVDNRAGKFGLAGHPFAVAPIRRLQPGYKWQHQFDVTPSGMRTAFDERGINSQRVAHMVPYIYNVITSPVSTMYKTVRMLLPGCYHDGESKLKRTERLRSQSKSNQLFLVEADYSNFDRFMAVDLIEEIISWFTEMTPNPSYWFDAMTYLHRDASLIWPDFSSVSQGEGWVFKPGQLGLLSGVKATSDTGTLVNSVVNGEALARTLGWNEAELTRYLLQYEDASVGSKVEYYYVQSDDTQLIQSSATVIKKHGDEFMKAVKAAGLKGSIELADRFLMRHLQEGSDRPVPARVWQNTLSNEAPPASEIVFLAGLGSRTDGLLGIKSVDPFQTGSLQRITCIEALFTISILKNLRTFISSASSPSLTALRLIDILLEEDKAIQMNYANQGVGSTFQSSPNVALKIGNIRRGITATLAQEQLTSSKLANADTVASWLYTLYKDQNIPSSALMLDHLRRFSEKIDSTITQFLARDEAFFKYATSTLGVHPLSW